MPPAPRQRRVRASRVQQSSVMWLSCSELDGLSHLIPLPVQKQFAISALHIKLPTESVQHLLYQSTCLQVAPYQARQRPARARATLGTSCCRASAHRPAAGRAPLRPRRQAPPQPQHTLGRPLALCCSEPRIRPQHPAARKGRTASQAVQPQSLLGLRAGPSAHRRRRPRAYPRHCRRAIEAVGRCGQSGAYRGQG